jgi:hypothetical protein
MKKFFYFILAILIINNANAQWQPVTFNSCNNSLIYTSYLGVIGNTIFASPNYFCNLIKSNDNGLTWSNASNGLPSNSNYYYATSIKALANDIYLSTLNSGVYKSTDYGNSWYPVNNGLSNLYVIDLLVVGNDIYAATYSGIFKSSNNGSSWVAANNGLNNTIASSLISNGTSIFAGTNGGVYVSNNSGNTWTNINNGLADTIITKIHIDDNNRILIGTLNGNIFASSNNGNSWNQIFYSPSFPYPIDWQVSGICNYGNSIFISLKFWGFYVSNDNGNNWFLDNNGLLDSVNCLVISNNEIFAGTWSGTCKRPLSQITDISNSSNINNIIVSSNPTGNILEIKFNQNLKKSTLNIYDVQGSKLIHKEINGEKIQINTSSFAKGVYLISIKNDNEAFIKKFIKQ